MLWKLYNFPAWPCKLKILGFFGSSKEKQLFKNSHDWIFEYQFANEMRLEEYKTCSKMHPLHLRVLFFIASEKKN